MNPDSYQIGIQQPIVIDDRFRQVQEFAFAGSKQKDTNDFFAFTVGKRILCKAQGLTGAEKRICGTQILAKCGRKPICVGVLSKKCKQRKADWLKCAQGVSYTSTQDGGIEPDSTTSGGGADAAPDTMADNSSEKIMGIDKNYLILGGLLIVLIGGTIAVVSATKSKKSPALRPAMAAR